MAKKSKLELCIEEAKRELGVRQRVYPEWIRMGRIDRKVAAARIELQEDIVKYLESLMPKQESLF